MDDKQLEALIKNPHYGCDEAGRGCLNGPVVVASCCLGDAVIPELNDSKQLSERKREYLYDKIVETAVDHKIIFVMPETIDKDNILQATLGGMGQSWLQSNKHNALLLVDGNKTPKPIEGLTCHAVVKGDGRVPAISAASILAKVSRDRWMLSLAKKYPHMEYERHKGYPTKRHVELLEQYGLNETYRQSFGPVKRLITPSQSSLF